MKVFILLVFIFPSSLLACAEYEDTSPSEPEEEEEGVEFPVDQV